MIIKNILIVEVKVVLGWSKVQVSVMGSQSLSSLPYLFLLYLSLFIKTFQRKNLEKDNFGLCTYYCDF